MFSSRKDITLVISVVNAFVCSAKLRISSDTTRNPLPASPARALSIAAQIAKELVCEMIKRDKSTVPDVSGKTNNYTYSIYDSQDETVLLAGINTDACFRINGMDNDFLHYCVLDKNGFIIKITDSFGNFIGRASGFRNGNGVYINQLRTIYDEGGCGYRGNYENEKLY